MRVRASVQLPLGEEKLVVPVDAASSVGLLIEKITDRVHRRTGRLPNQRFELRTQSGGLGAPSLRPPPHCARLI